jgi:uncharacterized damage-inducible protein DinB
VTQNESQPASVAGMTTSLLSDAFRHHIWATEQVLEVCASLTPVQLEMPVPGTYGSIIDTLRHIVQADSFYLTIFTNGRVELIDKEAKLGVNELRSKFSGYGAEYEALLAGELDPDADVVERGDGWESHSKMGLRLAQVVHHGSDHRSQICTALTSLGVTPPDIDLWAYGEASDRTWDVSEVTA